MLRLSVLLLAACFVATHGATPRLAGDCIKSRDRSSLSSLFPSSLASITSPSTVAGVQVRGHVCDPVPPQRVAAHAAAKSISHAVISPGRRVAVLRSSVAAMCTGRGAFAGSVRRSARRS
eukprot:358413-Chlamydomonas_euryale.AAC.19